MGQQVIGDAARLTAIVEAQNDIYAELDLDRQMALATQRCLTLTGAAGAKVQLLDGDEFVMTAGCGTAQAHLGLRYPVNGSLSGLAVAEGTVMCSDDTELDPRVNRAACRDVNARAMVVVPLVHATVVLGVLVVIASEPNAFDDHDVSSLQLMAAILGTAVGNAREFDTKRRLLAERTAALEALEATRTQLELLATHDPLTGLANRRLLADRISQALRRRGRRRRTVALLFVDLDRFKRVNDRFGHAAGDAVLVAVASRLRHAIRDPDTVARLGGDEFVVLCEDVTDADEAETIARRVTRSLARPHSVSGEPVTVTASVGLVVATPEDSADSLLHRGDSAMYRRKYTAF